MTKAEKLLPLYKEKVEFLEKFILESAVLVEKYHWKTTNPDDLLKLDVLAEELEKITEKIDNIEKYVSS